MTEQRLINSIVRENATNASARHCRIGRLITKEGLRSQQWIVKCFVAQGDD